MAFCLELAPKKKKKGKKLENLEKLRLLPHGLIKKQILASPGWV